jgi:hypothetical protein
MGKNVVSQLPVPHDSTVDLLRKLGGVEGQRLEVKDANKSATPPLPGTQAAK